MNPYDASIVVELGQALVVKKHQFLGLFVALITFVSPSYSAQTGGTVVITAGVGSTITVTIPGTTMDLGTYNAGDTTTVFPFQATFRHNVNPRTDVTITASPAANSMTIANGIHTYNVNFSGYSVTGGLTLTGTFATGVVIARARRNTNYTFRFNTQAASPIPLNAASGLYTGNQTLTFSIL